jgi:hypothetical protein
MSEGETVDMVTRCPLEAMREEELIRIELRIAQRADQLAQLNGSSREKDVAHWLQAEHEMWDAWA